MRVAIIGAGVSGLSCAVELSAIAEVVVVHDQAIEESTSATATAVWHVYLVDPADALNLRWAERTLLKLVDLMSDSRSGLELVQGVELFRNSSQARPDWADSASNFEMLGSGELERRFPGVSWGYRLSVPAANMAKYLPWLVERAVAGGVLFRRESVRSLVELDGFDAIVNCAGLRSRDLVEDAEVFGMRGQYLVLEPSVGRWPTEYIGDDEHPDGMAYMIPRDNEILIGGTEERSEQLSFVVEESELRERAGTFCRSILEGARVKRQVVGIRPCRRSGHVRFGWDATYPRLFHNYGHGGSGFSLSWGCAESAREAIDSAVRGG